MFQERYGFVAGISGFVADRQTKCQLQVETLLGVHRARAWKAMPRFAVNLVSSEI